MAERPTRERPGWIDERLYPFEDRFLEVNGCRLHYIDEGEGPALVMLHGNPTWSFLYRDIVKGLRDRIRCVAVDYPGFGLSTAGPGYGYTPREHSEVVEQLVLELDLRDAAMMMQDWGGPIGFEVASRQAERFAGFVVANTFAWPVNDQLAARFFSGLMGGRLGAYLVLKRNLFVERVLPRGVTRRKLPAEVMAHYRGPFPDPESRRPVHVFPREIIRSTPFLSEVERGLELVRDRPALIVWGDQDPAFKARERERFERLFEDHRTVMLHGAGHYLQEDAAEDIVAAIRDWTAED